MAATAREVRKTVTVLFCDLVGSTPLGAELDAESLRAVQGRYFDAMRGVVEAHGGTVEKFIGDAVMAVFGVPQVHEDDAVRAVRAAAEMQRALTALNDDLDVRHGVRLEARIGLTSGEVVAGGGGDGQRLVTGDVVNTAKRLEEAAAPGDVVLGDGARRMLGEGVELERLEPLAVKGKPEPLPAWRLVSVRTDAASLVRHFETPLVGRRDELAIVREALESAATTRRCELVTILGGAGIGKSRLALELCETTASWTTRLTGRCLPYGDGITFWPIAQIVRELGGLDVLRPRLAALPDGEAIAERVAALVGRAETTASAEEAAWAVRRLFEIVAEERPLVVCFEDIHWAESTLLDLIDHVADRSNGPILLLCLARPDLLERRDRWGARGSNRRVVRLARLSDVESNALLDLHGARGLDQEVRRRVLERADGNPLYVEQIAALLLEDPAAAAIRVPPSLQGLLAARLERLTPAERAVLERAAVAGRDFWQMSVAALADDDLRPLVPRVLASLVRKSFVRARRPDSRRSGDHAYSFVHVLVRDAAYESLLKQERAELHERFAARLAQSGDDSPELEELQGYHLEQAYRYREQLGPVDEHARGLAARAGELLGAAGRRAFARDDAPAAIKLLDRALALVTARDPARLALMRELSSACWSVGEVARAEALLNGFLEAATELGDRRAEWYALLDRAMWRHLADPAATADELLEVSERAIHIFEELGDDCGLARAWRRLSYVPRARGHFAISQEAAEHAIAHARRAGDAQEEARSIDNLCTALLMGPTPADQGIERCESLLASARTRLMQANIVTPLAALEAMQGNFDEARALYRRAEATYEDLGLRLSLVATSEIVGLVELAAGDAVAAEAALRRGYAIAAPGGTSALVAFQAGLVANALLAQGRYEEADELARVQEQHVSRDDVIAQVQSRLVRARLRGRSEDHADAVLLAAEAVDRAAQTDALNVHADALLGLGEVRRAAGDVDEASTAVEAAIELYERKGNLVAARRATSLLELGVPPATL